jgi:hypothetical protein
VSSACRRLSSAAIPSSARARRPRARSRENLEILHAANTIWLDEIRKAGL